MRTQQKAGPHHPITIEPLGRRVTVNVGGMIVAQSDDALLQRRSSYPLAIYIPRKDAKMELLERTTRGSYCPYQGDASYYSMPVGGECSDGRSLIVFIASAALTIRLIMTC